MAKVVTLGEIMLRLAMPGQSRFAQALPGTVTASFAGAEANSAVTIARLGGEVQFVTALPDGPIGDACIADLRRFKVGVDHIVQTEGRLGIFYFEAGVNQRSGQVEYDRDDSCSAKAPISEYNWDAIFEGASWLLISGITPAISEVAKEVAKYAMTEARRRGIKVAFDVNFRAKLWQWGGKRKPEQLASDVLCELTHHCDLLLCGKQDAIKFYGIDGELAAEEIPAELAARYENLRWIASSVRNQPPDSSKTYGGILFDCSEGQLHRAPNEGGYAIDEVVDRLGIGDAFAGTLVWHLANRSQDSPAEAIEYAAAAGCLAHTIEGDYGLVTLAEVESLVNSGGFHGRVDR